MHGFGYCIVKPALWIGKFENGSASPNLGTVRAALCEGSYNKWSDPPPLEDSTSKDR